jgi:hypothetical protein
MWKRAPLIALLASGSGGLGCVPCGGTEYDTVTLNVALAEPAGTPRMDSRMLNELFDRWELAVWWQAAIADASAVTPATGLLQVTSAEDGLGLSIPFPLSEGQVLPVITVTATTGGSFESVADGSRSTFPADAAGVSYQHVPATPCTRAMPDACEMENAYRRQQVASGTLRVTAVRPLRLQLDATFAYPTESGLAPDTVSGDITFGVSHGSYCFDP